MRALDRWARQLRSWAIPDEIVSSAPESPYGFPPEVFRRRADTAAREEPSPSASRALEALPAEGVVLDVGCGGGAASMPLASRASLLIGVDSTEAMLEEFRQAGRQAGVRTSAIHGAWPEVAETTPTADVVVCNHVLYNVRDLGPFALALTEHARGRVVAELTDRHPLVWMNDLWRRFHGLARPEGPTADDAEAALRELGLATSREDHVLPPRTGTFERREEAVALVRRRLCLPAERDHEVAEALGELLVRHDGRWSAGPERRTVVALWWPGSGT